MKLALLLIVAAAGLTAWVLRAEPTSVDEPWHIPASECVLVQKAGRFLCQRAAPSAQEETMP